MLTIKIKKLRNGVTLPEYHTVQSAAMDIRAAIDRPVKLHPMERAFMPSGFAMEIPRGYEAQIRARSGLSIKHGICLANGVGTIDADFRGELQVLLINLGQNVYEIQPNERIAQMVIAKYERSDWQIVDSLETSERGDGGFGSTGKL